MKTVQGFIRLLMAIGIAAVATGAANADTRSGGNRSMLRIREVKELVSVIDRAAEEHPSAEAFRATERVSGHPDRESCTVVLSEDIVEYVHQNLVSLGYGGDPDGEDLEFFGPALDKMRKFLGRMNRFYRCESFRSGYMTRGEVTRYFGIDTSYKVEFEIGWED